jgi:hypothetical protein
MGLLNTLFKVIVIILSTASASCPCVIVLKRGLIEHFKFMEIDSATLGCIYGGEQ